MTSAGSQLCRQLLAAEQPSAQTRCLQTNVPSHLTSHIPTNREIWPSSFISTIGYHIKFCEVLYLLNFREAPIDTLLAAEIITMNSVNLNSLNKMEINTIVSTTISASENLKRLENTEYVYRKYQ